MRYPTPLSAKSSDSSRATKHPSRSPKANAAPSKGVHARKHALKASKTGRGSDYDPKPPRIVVHGLPGYTGGLLPPDAVDPRPPTLPLDGFECIRTLGDGAYGHVLLVRALEQPNLGKLARPGSLFAVKVLPKERMKLIDQARTPPLHHLSDYNLPTRNTLRILMQRECTCQHCPGVHG